MQQTPTHASARLTAIAGAALGLSMSLLIHRYWGIDHDAALYLGEGMMQRWPEIFGHDLFFAHGSQGRYTVMPWLIGLSLGRIDPALLFLFGGLAGLLLFAAAGWYCLRALLPPTQRYWAWLGALCLPSRYGLVSIFSYSEPFLTPRPFAEALCLLGIGLLARGRWALAIACVPLAGLLHPLQTIAALLVVWPWAVMRDRRWLHAAWLAVPVAALGLAGIAPFAGLFQQIDRDWLAELRTFNGQLFLEGWGMADYKVLAFDALVLGYGWRVLPRAFGGWCAAALAGLALGLAANLVLVDGLHLALPAGLQLWRAHWLAHWFAMAAIAALLFRDLQARDLPRALCLGLTVVLAWGAGLWAWLPFALLYACWPLLSGRMRPRLKAMLGLLFVLGMLLLLASHVATEFLSFKQAQYRLDLYALDRRLLVFPLLGLGLPLLGAFAWNRLAPTARTGLFVLALCPLVVLAALRWDARAPMARVLERNAFRSDLFAVALPRDAQVFWDKVSLVGTWLVLHRADYFSPQQLSGVAFSRETSHEARLRLERMNPLLRSSLYCQQLPREGDRKRCRVSDEGMRAACAPGTSSPPDYLILPYRQPLRELGSWTLADPASGEPLATYRLYACTDVVEQLQQPVPGA